MQSDLKQAELKPQDADSPAVAAADRVPRLGNRILLGKVPVKYVDWTILVVSLVLIAVFVFLIVSRSG